MQTAFRVFYALNLLGAFASVSILTYLWKRRTLRLGLASFIMMFSIAIWLVPNVVMWMVEDLYGSVFILKLGFLGAFFAPAAWFIYSLYFVGKEAWANRTLMRLLAVIPVFLFGLVLTDRYWTSLTYHQEGWISYLEVVYSDWLYLGMVYSYALIGAGIVLIIRAIIAWPQIYRHRGIILLAGMLFPLLANLVFVFRLVPNLHVDFTPLSLLFSSLILIWGGLRYQLFDLVPVARDALVENISDGMIVLDSSGCILDHNRAAAQILGKSLQQTRKHPLILLLPQIQPVLQQPENGAERQNELLLIRQEHSTHYEVNLLPINSRDGKLAGTLVLLHDITERKQAELQLQQALSREKALAESRARFVAVASHAFRTPLSVIQSSVQFLNAYFNNLTAPKRAEILERIQESVDRMTDLLKRMLLFEEIQTGKTKVTPTAVDLATLCRQVIHDLASEVERNPIHFTQYGSQLDAMQDKDMLYQVLVNLLSNAAKYSQPGQPVELTLRVEEKTACIEVHDAGIGIPPADLPHLGEAFFRGINAYHKSGSGLGLLIVNQALQLIGGALQVESQEGKGTLMRVTFPLKLANAPAEN